METSNQIIEVLLLCQCPSSCGNPPYFPVSTTGCEAAGYCHPFRDRGLPCYKLKSRQTGFNVEENDLVKVPFYRGIRRLAKSF